MLAAAAEAPILPVFCFFLFFTGVDPVGEALFAWELLFLFFVLLLPCSEEDKEGDTESLRALDILGPAAAAALPASCLSEVVVVVTIFTGRKGAEGEDPPVGTTVERERPCDLFPSPPEAAMDDSNWR